jgi:hypothetical protein
MKTSAQPTRQRWAIIGPGLLLALILAVAFVLRDHQSKARPPIVERQVVSRSRSNSAKPTPKVTFITEHADELHLTRIQSTSLAKLTDEWKREANPVKRRMDAAAARYRKEMAGARHLTAAEIEAKAAPVMDLTWQWISLKRKFWEKGLQVLNDKQRRQIEDLAKGQAPEPQTTGGPR